LNRAPTITSIVFGIDNPPTFQGDFAIGTLPINTGSVPEPASLVLAMFAIAVGLGIGWRVRERASSARS
jgi:hypothetical protein